VSADDPERQAPFIVLHGASADHALDGAVFAIGNFDGVHQGHRQVIATARARADRLGAKAAVLTFEPHPRSFFRPQQPLFRLTDGHAKLRLLAATELDGALVLRFDAALAGVSAEDFIARILVGRYAVAGVTVGPDFRFGRNRAGSPDTLAAQGERLGFAVDVVPRFDDAGRAVRSGPIREALGAGNIAEANELLGYPWFVTARVTHGDKRGRELGYPTANLRLDPACGLAHGIYAVRVGVRGRLYEAVASFGRRPMFDQGTILLEVFLFEFAGELYGESLDVAFIAWLRPECKFDSGEALVAQMGQDAEQARQALARAPGCFPQLGSFQTAD
jgi:riboflavin kinase/FMN adenylyltransferase